MSKNNNLNDFLKDLADGIRTAEGSTTPINPQDFRSRVEALPNSGGGGESGVPIEVATLPTATADTVGKVYLNTTDGNYYVSVGGTLAVGEPMPYSIKYDMNIVPEIVGDEAFDGMAIWLMAGDGGIMGYPESLMGADLIAYADKTSLIPLYVQSTSMSVDEVNANICSQFGVSITAFGWQGDGVIDTSGLAGTTVDLINDTQGILSASPSFVLSNNDEIKALTTANETLTTENETLTTANETLTSEKSNLQTQVSTLTSENQSLTYQNTSLQNQVSSLTTENETLTQQKNEYMTKYYQAKDGSFGTDYVCDSYHTVIRAYYFANSQSLTTITLSNNLVKIGEGAFLGCSQLSSINLPDSVTSIGAAAFAKCVGLKSITIPAGVTSIPNNCFDAMEPFGTGYYSTMRLSSVVFAENSQLQSIGENAFRYCLSLKEVTLTATTPPTLDSSAFYGCTSYNGSLTAIYVPAESVEAYKSATGWSNYADLIQAIAE